MATSAGSLSRATCPTVTIPRSWSLAAVTAPTPQSRSTGRGWRNASSRSGGPTRRPSGFATLLGRGVERVEVGVEDGGLRPSHEHMFARGGDAVLSVLPSVPERRSRTVRHVHESNRDLALGTLLALPR